MKVVWEEEDVNPGLVVGKKGRDERFMIGYDQIGPTNANFAIIALNNGCIIKNNLTAPMICTFLNGTGDIPATLLMDPRLNGKAK